MAKNIDEIFSPERIRQNWNQANGKAGKQNKPKEPASILSSVMAEFDHLQILIRQRFSGEKSFALNVMMEGLQDLLGKRFPDGEEEKITLEDALTFNQAIEEVLNQIEDLVEAYEL